MKQKLYWIGGTKNFTKKFEIKARKEGFHPIEILPSKSYILVNKKNVDLFQDHKKLTLDKSIFFNRMSEKYIGYVSFIYKLLEYKKVPFTDKGVSHSNMRYSKPYQAIELGLSGIPYPKSMILDTSSFDYNQSEVLKHFTFPLVVKKDGSKGNAVWKINNLVELQKNIMSSKGIVLIQEYIENNFDIRVVVIGGNIIGAIQRSSSDDFYNNIAKGAQASPIKITEKESQIALKSAKAMSLDFAGVDIVRTKNGPKIFEINKSPAFLGFENTTGIDVISELFTNLINNMSSDSSYEN